jgi:hypothetical protein
VEITYHESVVTPLPRRTRTNALNKQIQIAQLQGEGCEGSKLLSKLEASMRMNGSTGTLATPSFGSPRGSGVGSGNSFFRPNYEKRNSSSLSLLGPDRDSKRVSRRM